MQDLIDERKDEGGKIQGTSNKIPLMLRKLTEGNAENPELVERRNEVHEQGEAHLESERGSRGAACKSDTNTRCSLLRTQAQYHVVRNFDVDLDEYIEDYVDDREEYEHDEGFIH